MDQDEECTEIYSGCTRKSVDRLGPFFGFYENVTAYYPPDVVGNSHSALQSHKDLRDVVPLLKKKLDVPRNQLSAEYFGTRFPVFSKWGIRSSLLREDPGTTVAHFPSITAKRLSKAAKLQVVPTAGLSRHLYLDEENETVCLSLYERITALVASPCVVHDSSPSALPQNLSESRGQRQQQPHISVIPLDLAIETLSTIKDVLFPDDWSSHSLLRVLISRQGFDPDIARTSDQSAQVSRNMEGMQYCYWQSRLIDLGDELENPTPRGVLEKYFQRKSAARHVIMATIAGVAIAVIVGIFSLAVSIFQAWVGWQQWQHPITSS
ncbi:hypothetical protein QQS21_001480 [Conoideocrella luteorostrata]|uniref:Uncharacterized protein n=1 Tax=Conoideocrella luteorostrata TaxID=1105319 RepID=A0AAJ0CX04_9HYPO|nr:hypothetical protein QQS21_001480 [Conoideocrella luteorostrata]